MGMPVKFVHGETRRACATCATAKTKCVSSSTNSSCDRCLLLKKACVLRPENSNKRKRRTAQAVLADKVDEIVALLKVGADQGGQNQGGHQISIPERPAQTVEPSSSFSFPSSIACHGLTVGIDEAAELLAHFRQHQAVLAPYVDIPETVTVVQLRDEKPLLLLAIMTAASHHDARSQEDFSKASIALLADHVLIRGHKNLALLQGMMLLLGWSHTQSLVNPQITNLLHLCMAMSVDLGLNQSTAAPATESQRAASLLDGPRRTVHGPAFASHIRTLEERRTYAGCYYLSAVVTTSLIIPISTALPWSAQLDDACDVLSRSGIANDLRLARLVKLQHIISQISETKKHIMSSGHGAVTPLSIYISPFETTLRNLWDDTPEEVRQDICLNMAYHTAHTHLYQISLPPTITSAPSRPSSPTTPIPTAISIAETRVLCLQAALAGMEVHFSVPPTELYHMPLTFWAMTGHMLTTLARLRACASPPSPGRSDPLHFNLAQLIERAAVRLEEAGGGGPGGSSSSPPSGRAGPAAPGSDDDNRASSRKGKNDRLVYWAGCLRRCARALGIIDGSSGGPDIPGFLSAMGACRKEAVGGRKVADQDLADGNTVVGQNGQQREQVLEGQDIAAGGYMTPLSGLDVGRVAGTGDGAGDVLGLQEGESFPMEWTAAFLEDISGFGLFGMADDFLMQDMFAGGGGGGDAG